MILEFWPHYSEMVSFCCFRRPRLVALCHSSPRKLMQLVSCEVKMDPRKPGSRWLR